MQQKKIIVAFSVLFVVILFLSGTILVAPGEVEAKAKCHKINTTLSSVADLVNFTTEGQIQSGFLKGTTRFTGVPAGPVGVDSLSYAGTLEITTPKGMLTTVSVGSFETVPPGLGAQYDRVVSGTGLFAEAEGYLFFNFESDESGGNFVSAVTGEICVK